MGRKSMTYRQLAELAGVSVSTVSKVFAGSDEISAGTSQRIKQLSKEYGIDPPKYNHSRPFQSVAILASETISRFCSQTINIVSDILLKKKIIPAVFVCGYDSVQYRAILETISLGGYIGIISLCDNQHISQNVGIPFLSISYRKMIYGAFSSDGLRNGIAQAICYLVSLGHTQIGYIGRKESASEINGFRQIMQLMGVSLNPEFYHTSSNCSKYDNEIAQYYISLPLCPTALISSDDEIAINAINSFKRLGIRIPDDISIIGVGNTLCSKCDGNMLTTVEITISDTVAAMVKMFISDILSNRKISVEYVAPQSELIVRETTGKPRTTLNLNKA